MKFNFFLPCFSSFHCRPDKVHIYLNLWLIGSREKEIRKVEMRGCCARPRPVSECLDQSSICGGYIVPVLARAFDEYLLASEFYRFMFFVRLDLIRIFCAERTRTTRILLIWHLTRCQRSEWKLFFFRVIACDAATDWQTFLFLRAEWMSESGEFGINRGNL